MVLNNLLKSFLDFRATPTERYFDQILTYDVSLSDNDPISKRENLLLQQELPYLFVQVSELLYNSQILSPQRYLLFGCFHAPKALSPTTLNALFRSFEHAQPSTSTLFMNSQYHSLVDSEPKRFAKRCSFLAWLLYGRGFNDITDMELNAPVWNKQAKGAIHRAKNHSKTIVFRHLMVALHTSSGPLGFEPLWVDLRRRVTRYLDSSGNSHLQRRLRAWKTSKSPCSAQNNLQDLYAIAFTKHPSFSEWLILNAQQAQRSFQHFCPIYYQIMDLLQQKQLCYQHPTVEKFPY